VISNLERRTYALYRSQRETVMHSIDGGLIAPVGVVVKPSRTAASVAAVILGVSRWNYYGNKSQFTHDPKCGPCFGRSIGFPFR
jgi:hypothetical protein